MSKMLVAIGKIDNQIYNLHINTFGLKGVMIKSQRERNANINYNV